MFLDAGLVPVSSVLASRDVSEGWGDGEAAVITIYQTLVMWVRRSFQES